MKLNSMKRTGFILQALTLIGLLISLNAITAADTPWYATWGGSGYDQGTGIAIDSDGNIYCVGTTTSFSSGVNDMVLIKYFPNGTVAWTQLWGGTGSDTGSDVAVDSNGSIYCVGSTNSIGAGQIDLLVVKFFPNGTEAWNSTWGSIYNDAGSDIAIGPNGSIYCVGTTSFIDSDIAVVKFDSETGAYNDHTTWGTTVSETGYVITVADDGAIYCAGTGYIDAIKGYDTILIKFYQDMTEAWNYSWGRTASDYPYGIAVDSNYVYCSGETWASSRRYVALSKLQCASGTEVWNTTWGTAGEHESASGIVVNATEHILCTGYVASDLTLFLFNPDGSLARTTSWGGSGGDFGDDLAIGLDNCIYCVGKTTSIGEGEEDLVLVKFLSDGTPPSSPDGGGIPGFLLPATILFLITLVLLVSARKKNWRTF